MNTDQMDKKIVVQQVVQQAEEKSCKNCHYFTKVKSFPGDSPCNKCVRLSRWLPMVTNAPGFFLRGDGDETEFAFKDGLPTLCPMDFGEEQLTPPTPPYVEAEKHLAKVVDEAVMEEVLKEAKIDFGGEQLEQLEQLPDSGKRREFSTGSVRDVREGKGRYDLLSPIALKAYAKRMEDGMSKYGERNWEKGQPVMSYIDSGLRHLNNFIEDGMFGWKPEEDHLGAAMWNIASAIHTIEMIKRGILPNKLDDTPKLSSVLTDAKKED